MAVTLGLDSNGRKVLNIPSSSPTFCCFEGLARCLGMGFSTSSSSSFFSGGAAGAAAAARTSPLPSTTMPATRVGHTTMQEPVLIHLTGFGPFGDVLKNPSSEICEELRSFVEKGVAPEGVPAYLLTDFAASGIRLQGLEAVEVSAEGCREASTQIHEALAECAGTSAVLHLGVSSMCEKVHLECRGINEASFRIPDVRGSQPGGERVVNDPEAPDQIFTSINLPSLLAGLHDRGVSAAISTDAGRYLCNYIFYYSLHLNRRRGVPVLFVHVPLFEKMKKANQVSAILNILMLMADQLRRRQGERGRANGGSASGSPTNTGLPKSFKPMG